MKGAPVGRPPPRFEGPVVRPRPRWVFDCTLGVIAVTFLLVSVSAEISKVGPLGRKHLAPIPISASACPYVRAMHVAANNFQATQPFFGTAVDARGRPLTWPQTRARLDVALRRLEFAIVVSRPQFPPPIQRQLMVTANAVHSGLGQLSQSRDGFDLIDRSQTNLDTGKHAFGYASDLVGKQCRVPLGADDRTLFPVEMAPTRVTEPRREGAN